MTEFHLRRIINTVCKYVRIQIQSVDLQTWDWEEMGARPKLRAGSATDRPIVFCTIENYSQSIEFSLKYTIDYCRNFTVVFYSK